MDAPPLVKAARWRVGFSTLKHRVPKWEPVLRKNDAMEKELRIAGDGNETLKGCHG